MAAAAPNFNFGFPTPGPQNPSADHVMDHVFFLSNEQWKKAREDEKFDFIIVGSGFCGYAFAQRIYEQNRNAKILMLERGTFFLPEHFQNLSPTYFKVLGGLSETFPWTITRETLRAQNVFQHGMVPFVGGRSIMWSAWCPEPSKSELEFFPASIVDALNKTYFASATKTLHVVHAHEIEERYNSNGAGTRRPVYGQLHAAVHSSVSKIWLKDHAQVSRVLHAPLAVGMPSDPTYDFFKFSVPAPLLDLITTSQTLQGSSLQLATNCTVEKILHSDNGKGEVIATALQTSRGVVSIRDAKVILASGTLPPTTLVQNSFPKQCPEAGNRFTAHVISSITARIKTKNITENVLEELEIGAVYLDRLHTNGLHFHIQMSIFCVNNIAKNLPRTLRYTPDVIAAASKEQLEQSEGYVIFVCAVLGELDHGDSPQTASTFTKNIYDSDVTTNSLLNVIINPKTRAVWDAMDAATFHLLDNIAGPANVEYWTPNGPLVSEGPRPTGGKWCKIHPEAKYIRAPDLVHEGSTLHIGSNGDASALVNEDYRLKGVENVYITGGSLWPKGGSWNPTLTMVGMAQHLADSFFGGPPSAGKKGKTPEKKPVEPSPSIFLHSCINAMVMDCDASKFSKPFQGMCSNLPQ